MEKTSIQHKRVRGFVLIEVMVAILIVALGILALAQLESHVVGAAGEAKSRSSAMALARSRIDDLRGTILKSQYDTNLASGSGSQTVQLNGIDYSVAWTVANTTSGSNALENRLVQVDVTWTDRAGNTQHVYLNTQVAWNDPALSSATRRDLGSNLIAPSGMAKRGGGAYSPGDTAPHIVTGDDNITKLVNSAGDTILYLDPVGDTPQQFTKIYGRVYFDQGANQNQIPDSPNIYVRLSSEGECVYSNRTAALQSLPVSGTAKYKYFNYVCYVGPSWYGNVGVSVIGSTRTPTICAGDPKVANTGATTSPHAVEAVTRSYRGFKWVDPNYISTGVEGGTLYGDDGTVVTKAGKPKPFDFPAIYTWVTANDSTNNFFNQDFLITNVSGQTTCADRMQLISGANTFSPNAGKYYCISPDDDLANDQCPNIWPGFGGGGACGAITVSGSLTYSTNASAISSTTSLGCSNNEGHTCTCQATTGTANFECATTGSSTAALTITAAGSVTVYDSNWATQTCIPASSCVAPAATTDGSGNRTEYQCVQGGCASGLQSTQSRSVSYGAWLNTACVPSASCSAPANTSSTEYQCVQSGCNAGESVVQSRSVGTQTITDSDTTATTNSVQVSTVCQKNMPSGGLPGASSTSNTVNGVTTTVTTSYSNGVWTTANASCGTGGKVTWKLSATRSVRTVVTHIGNVYGNWTDASPACSTTNPPLSMADGSVEYRYIQGSCNGQNKVLQHRAASFESWSNTAATCVATSAPLPVTSGQVWQSITSGCPTGAKQFQSKAQVGTPTTVSCVRTLNPLGCSSLSGINIDSSTATCQ